MELCRLTSSPSSLCHSCQYSMAAHTPSAMLAKSLRAQRRTVSKNVSGGSDRVDGLRESEGRLEEQLRRLVLDLSCILLAGPASPPTPSSGTLSRNSNNDWQCCPRGWRPPAAANAKSEPRAAPARVPTPTTPAQQGADGALGRHLRVDERSDRPAHLGRALGLLGHTGTPLPARVEMAPGRAHVVFLAKRLKRRGRR